MWILPAIAPSPALAAYPAQGAAPSGEWRHSVELTLAPVEGAFRYRGEPYDQEGLKRELRIVTDTRWRDAPLDDERPGVQRELLRVRGELEVLDHDDAPPDWSKPMAWQAPLEGVRVDVFEDGKSPELSATQPGGGPVEDLDDETLSGLALREYSDFLPPSTGHGPGEPYEVPAGAIEVLLAPGGDVAAGTGMRGTFLAGGLSGFTAPYPPLDLAPYTGGEARGTILARAQRSDEGVLLVTLEFDVRIVTDRSGWVEAQLDARLDTEVERYELQLELDGEASLRFGADGRRLLDADVQADVSTRLDAVWDQRGSMLEALLEHEGELSLGVRAPG